VEADTGALNQAILVVILSSIATGPANIGSTDISGIIIGIIIAFAGWLLWAFLIYIIEIKLLPEPQTSSNQGGTTAHARIFKLSWIDPGLGDSSVALKAVFFHCCNLDSGGNGNCCQKGPQLQDHMAYYEDMLSAGLFSC